MAEWLDGWIVGWMAEWLDGWIVGWMAGWLSSSASHPACQLILGRSFDELRAGSARPCTTWWLCRPGYIWRLMKIENSIRVRPPNEPRLDNDARPPMERRPELVEGLAGYKAAPHHLDKLDAPQWGLSA